MATPGMAEECTWHDKSERRRSVFPIHLLSASEKEAHFQGLPQACIVLLSPMLAVKTKYLHQDSLEVLSSKGRCIKWS